MVEKDSSDGECLPSGRPLPPKPPPPMSLVKAENQDEKDSGIWACLPSGRPFPPRPPSPLKSEEMVEKDLGAGAEVSSRRSVPDISIALERLPRAEVKNGAGAEVLPPDVSRSPSCGFRLRSRSAIMASQVRRVRSRSRGRRSPSLHLSERRRSPRRNEIPWHSRLARRKRNR